MTTHDLRHACLCNVSLPTIPLRLTKKNAIYTYIHLRKAASLRPESFGSGRRGWDPPKKGQSMTPAQRERLSKKKKKKKDQSAASSCFHHCHRARHIRWEPVPVLIRALSGRLSVCLYRGASAVLQAKLACLFSRQRNIQSYPVASDNPDHPCQ